MPEVLKDKFLDDDKDLSNKTTRPTKYTKVNIIDAIRLKITTVTPKREISQPLVSKQKLEYRKATEKHKQMLDKVEKLRKSLNPKKPKRIKEPHTSDTNTPLNAMAQTFAEYIQYLKT